MMLLYLHAAAVHSAAFACCCLCTLLPLHVLSPCHGLLPLHAAMVTPLRSAAALSLYAAAAFARCYGDASACSAATAWADAWHSAVADVFACYYCLCMLLHLQVFCHCMCCCCCLCILWLLLLLHAAATDASYAAEAWVQI